MARQFYTEGLRQLIENGDWVTGGDYRATLVASGYTFSAAHTAMTSVGSQITGADESDGNGVALTGEAYLDVTDGTGLDCDNITFPSVPSGATVDALVIYAEGGGTSGTRVPLLYIDEDSDGSPISLDTYGNNIDVTVGANGLATITRNTTP